MVVGCHNLEISQGKIFLDECCFIMEGNIKQKLSRLKVYILRQSELTHFSLPEL